MSRYLCLNKDSRYIYIFDWTTHLLCLTNVGGDVLERLPLELPVNCTPSAFSRIILSGIQKLSQQRPIPAELMLGLGITLPGLVDSRDYIALYSTELGWRDVNIRDLFSDHFGADVFLEHTANMNALGECVFGAGRGFDRVMLILLENEGIGLSSVLRGECQHGDNYMYGELGHIKLPSNIVCSCGQRGCLEAIVHDCMMKNGGVMDDEVLEYISFGVSAAVNIADPSTVLLYGKLTHGLTPQQEEQLIARIRKKITNERSRVFTIQVCRNQDMMGVKGMSAYVFDNCFPILSRASSNP